MKKKNKAHYELYKDLLDIAKTNGIKVKLVTTKKLKDYLGMNWKAAETMGFTMSDGSIYILRSSPIEVKCNTLHHELVEAGLMEEGHPYWEAHKEALVKEDDHIYKNKKNGGIKVRVTK